MELWVIDRAGNIGTASYTITLDTTVPTAAVEFPVATDDVKVGSYSITLNIGAIVSELATTPNLYFTANGKSEVLLTLNSSLFTGLYTATLDINTYTGDGIATFRVEATDNAGNIANTLIEPRLYISTDINVIGFDITDPTSGSSEYSNEQTIYVEITNDEQAVEWLIKEVIATPSISSDQWISDRPSEYTFMSVFEEVKTVYVWVKNANDSISAISIASITYDITQASIASVELEGGTNKAAAGLFAVTFNMNEELINTPSISIDGISIELTRADSATYTGAVYVSHDWSVGSHEWSMSVTDNAGNATVADTTAAMTLDNAANIGSNEYFTIQAALNSANANETVTVQNGTWSGIGNVGIIWPNEDDISLAGNGLATVLDAAQVTRHIYVGYAVSLEIKELTIVNGSVSDNTVGESGGVILMVAGASLTMDSSIVSGNKAKVGGVFAGGNTVIINTLIKGNSADTGSIFSTGINKVVNTTIVDNVGSIYDGSAAVELSAYNSIFAGSFNSD